MPMLMCGFDYCCKLELQGTEDWPQCDQAVTQGEQVMCDVHVHIDGKMAVRRGFRGDVIGNDIQSLHVHVYTFVCVQLFDCACRRCGHTCLT